VIDRTGIGVPPEAIDRAAVERSATAAVEKLGVHVRREAREGEVGWQLTVALQLTMERSARPDDAGVVPADHAHRAAGVSLRLAALGRALPEGLRGRYEAEALVARNAPIFESEQALIDEAIDMAARYIGLELELSRAPTEDVLRRLDDTDPKVRARVIGELRERGASAAAVPRLVTLLGGDEADPDVLLAATGALIESKDPRAVAPLIESARRRSPVYLSQIIFGVAEIGGKEAEAYLFTVASGHPDPAIKKAAQDALDELERRTASRKEEAPR
jgi:hypothetical protein